MIEEYAAFDTYVRLYGLQRVEGTLLRYLGQVYGTLQQTVPDAMKTDELHDVIAYFRALVARVDSSLLQEWESLLAPTPATPSAEAAPPRLDLALTPKAFRARVRAEMRSFVRALAAQDYEEAARWLSPDADEPWDATRLEHELAPLREACERVVFDPAHFRADRTAIRDDGPRRWRVQQVLPDPGREDLWCLEGAIDLSTPPEPDAPLVRPISIHD
jgi:hypothetical protein